MKRRPGGELTSGATGSRRRAGAGSRERRRRLALAWSVVVGLAASVAALLGHARRDERGPPPPPWSFPDVVGERGDGRWSARKELTGPTLVAYLSARCPHCRRQAGVLAELATTEREALWVINAGPRVAWLPDALRGRVVADGDGAIARALGLWRVPAVFGVDGHGVVRIVREGVVSREQLLRDLDSLTDFAGR